MSRSQHVLFSSCSPGLFLVIMVRLCHCSALAWWLPEYQSGRVLATFGGTSGLVIFLIRLFAAAPPYPA